MNFGWFIKDFDGYWPMVAGAVRTFHSVLEAKALLVIERSTAEIELWATLWRVFNSFTSGMSVVGTPNKVSAVKVAEKKKRLMIS